LKRLLSSIRGERRDALRAEVIKAGIADLAFNEMRFLKRSPAERTPFHGLFA